MEEETAQEEGEEDSIVDPHCLVTHIKQSTNHFQKMIGIITQMIYLAQKMEQRCFWHLST